MKDLVIVGAGGFGREVAWLVEDINENSNEWNLLGFIDDKYYKKADHINGYNIIGDIDWLLDKDYYVVIAIGDCLSKKVIYNKIKNTRNKFASLIHPDVKISKHVDIGEGCIICAGNIITVNIKIGNQVIVNLDSTIGHDAIIKDFSTILPSVNVSGNVTIGECVNVGTGTAIIQGINICDNVIIGAGSVVVKDIIEAGTYVGSPAKKIK